MPPFDQPPGGVAGRRQGGQVRCRSCYSDHDYRKEQAPPSKKELAKQKELFNAVLAGMAPPEIDLEAPLEIEIAAAIETSGEIEAATEPDPRRPRP